MSLEDKISGTAKEAEGKLTGDRSREAEGRLEKAKGEAEDAGEHVKDAAGNLLDRAREEIGSHRSHDDAPGGPATPDRR
jgi:uncharacterized protein YjbJ (UPF0337 family)